MGFTGGSDGKEPACNAWDLSFIPGLGRSSKEGNGYPLQYSCLENSVDRGASQATVHGVPKSQTWLKDFHFTSWWQRAPGRKYPPLWQRGLWVPVNCECGVCSQWREMTRSPLCCSTPFALPLPGPLTKGCCCPFSWLPSSLPSTANQSQIWGSNQGMVPYRPSRSEETKFLTRDPVPSLCIQMKSVWHAHRRRSHLYPDALGMIPPEWVSSPCSLSHSGKIISEQWWLGIGMGQELPSNKCHVTADTDKGLMWVSAGISGIELTLMGQILH